MEKIREIIFYEDYFLGFYNTQDEKVQNKIDEILFMITGLERIPRKFFDHLTGTKRLYEIRIELEGNILEYFVVLMKVK